MATFVTRQGWQRLLSLMEKKLPNSVEIYGLLKNSLTGDWPFYNFWVDQWPHVTAVVASPKYRLLDDFSGKFTVLYGQEAGVVTNMLLYPGVIPWSRDLTFDLPPHLYPALTAAAQKSTGELSTISKTTVLTVTKDKFIKIDAMPEEFVSDKLTRADAAFVAEKLSIKEPGVKDFIERLISTNIPSRCARTVHDGKIRAFHFTHPTSMLGMWYVEPSFRRLSIGRVIACRNTEMLLQTSPIAATMIESTNIPSIKGTSTVGFEPIAEMFTVRHKPFHSCSK